MNADLQAALKKLGLSTLDERVVERLEAVITNRAKTRADQARERELVKARTEQLEPSALVRTLAEALLPGQKRRGPKPRGSGDDIQPGSASIHAPTGSNEPAEKGVSGVQDA
jgi:hypothetical protein